MNPILIVDDNEQIVRILTQYTQAEGWPCLAARTGEEALSLFDSAAPSVILLDIMLPGIDGLEVCRRIRHVSGVPIIMITARDEDADRILGLDIGADFTPLTDCCGYDQCYVIRDSGLRHAAWVVGPETGIRMEVLTTLPGVHLYTANFLAPVTAGKDGAHYAARDAVCFETEDFPDAPNHPNFPDTTLLPGKPYSSTTIYRFDLAEM